MQFLAAFLLHLVRMIWYYIDETVTEGDRRKGPFSIDEIKDFVKAGTIKPETLVWHSGMEAWVAWAETEEAKEAAAENMTEEEQVKAALEAILAQHKTGKRYATFLTRALAYFVDNFILSAFGVVMLLVMNQMQLVDLAAISDAMNAYITDPNSESALNNLLGATGMHLFLTIWGIVQAIYFIVFNALTSSTPGKRLFKIHIETFDGEKLTWLSAIVRYVASIFTQFTLMFYGLGYLIVILDPKRRALHDFVVRTRVVHEAKVITVSKAKLK